VSLVEQLHWDSSFFGFPIGRIKSRVTASDIELATREADDRKLRCVYLLAPAGDDTLICSAQEHGFRVRDIRVELERPVVGHPIAMDGLRRGQIEDLLPLAQIARERFLTTRFFADKRFPPERSADLYVEWLRKGLMGAPDRQTLVNEDLTGFIICHLDPSSSMGKIELIGVAAGASGQGLGSALTAAAEAAFADASLDTALVVTQGSNIVAQRLYQRLGYRIYKTHLWLHRWL
jgi:dTDP-4-amino-4,6-dideoxy-D-galactose acyltransferase